VNGDSILVQVAHDVLGTVQANWVYLLVSIVLASAVQVFVGTDRLARWLRARPPLAVLGAVALGALTPFCSCGTTAVVLGALASAVPWAPVVAFMVSSPLTSPGEYIMSVGLFGTAFATTYFVAAFLIGLGAGWVAHRLERAGLLRDQHRVALGGACDATPVRTAAANLTGGVAPAGEPGAPRSTPGLLLLEAAELATAAAAPAPGMACCGPAPGGCTLEREEPAGFRAATPAGGAAGGVAEGTRVRAFAAALVANTRRLGILFLGFTSLGYLVIRLIPAELLTSLLGNDNVFAVPLAALLGIPVYVSSDGSLPLVASLMDGGMGSGAAMAFLITGAGTSIGAVSGMLLIARWRVVALVVASLVVGATVTGYLTPLIT
jgi:uncharacterized membrane protein YraQ (UPF0718 family)